ncbi:uncharacterized protein MONBRDRAFT_31349 [Monosiga brevicollis MX1]|uniref:Uncharacterized protein n=1 Tax=Monosiga brevicollis TaxID=81824 RepID=A9URE8_MONBE|nr:uncharacterized protein MONBRDRAFT_31349 [Monosiga brevicollis MX1]EDQ92232.1 predicted protein [Monosiga brevicollis MX1]|eukprot:XP_001743518.1 hypothetical protein [Monosiga brevicollis MX1]
MSASKIGVYQVLALLLVIGISLLVLQHGISLLDPKAASLAGFQGPHWHHPGETIETKEILDAAYARVESHTIRTSGGQLISGWIWVDFLDRVDVLVETTEGTFLLFEQTNYGLGENSLAVVSRHLQPHEEPIQAAKHELLSEMGRVAEEWVHLGHYRGDANRGAGTVTCVLARRSSTIENESRERPKSNDLERKKLIELSQAGLRDALLLNRFREIKWTATVALALLKLDAER